MDLLSFYMYKTDKKQGFIPQKRIIGEYMAVNF